MRGGEGRALGRAVAVDETRCGTASMKRRTCATDGASPPMRFLQTGRVPRVVVDHGVEQRGGERAVVTPCARITWSQPGPVGTASSCSTTRPPFEARPQARTSGIEAQRRGMQHHRRAARQGVVPPCTDARWAMRNLDTWAGPSNPGVHHVGERFAGDGCSDTGSGGIGQRIESSSSGPAVSFARARRAATAIRARRRPTT